MSGTSNRHRTGPLAVRALRACLGRMCAPAIDIPTLVRKLDEAGFAIVDKNADYKAPEGRGNEAFKKVKETRRIAQIGKRVAARRARRGSDDAFQGDVGPQGYKPIYTGPDLIGKSHSQRILDR